MDVEDPLRVYPVTLCTLPRVCQGEDIVKKEGTKDKRKRKQLLLYYHSNLRDSCTNLSCATEQQRPVFLWRDTQTQAQYEERRVPSFSRTAGGIGSSVPTFDVLHFPGGECEYSARMEGRSLRI